MNLTLHYVFLVKFLNLTRATWSRAYENAIVTKQFRNVQSHIYTDVSRSCNKKSRPFPRTTCFSLKFKEQRREHVRGRVSASRRVARFRCLYRRTQSQCGLTGLSPLWLISTSSSSVFATPVIVTPIPSHSSSRSPFSIISRVPSLSIHIYVYIHACVCACAIYIHVRSCLCACSERIDRYDYYENWK